MAVFVCTNSLEGIRPVNDEFTIQKEILQVQWTNIRFYWDKANQAVLQMTAVPFVLLFGNFLKQEVQLADRTRWMLKIVLSVAVLLFGVLVFMTLQNYYQRSLRARKIVVEIEKRWKLYEQGGLFSIQDPKDEYRYSAFAHETHIRMSHQRLQIIYGVLVTILSEIAVCVLF